MTGTTVSIRRGPIHSTLGLFGIPLAALALLAQQPSQSELRGVVLDAGTDVPLAGATVTLVRWRTRLGDRPTPIQLTTGNDGRFQASIAEPGTYSISATKDGYTTTTPGTSASITIDPARPVREIVVRLTRPGDLTGRVIDDQTGAPVAGQRVDVNPFFYSNGHRQWLMGRFLHTDADGRFTAKGLSPDNYLVSIPYREMHAAPFNPGDLDSVDQGYEKTYWPAGKDMDTALPISVTPGGLADLGTFRLKKIPLYRIRLLIDPAACAPGETAKVIEHLGPIGSIDYGGVGDIPCGEPYLLTGYSYGSYWLGVEVNKRNPANRAAASVPVEVRGRNQEITVHLEHGVDLGGRILTDDGAAKPDFHSLRISLRSLDGRMLPASDVSSDPQGNFRFPNLVGGSSNQVRIAVANLAPGFYVKEVRYNGTTAAAGIFPWSGSGSVDIIVDDKAAAVTGSVADHDRPVSNAAVVVAMPPAYGTDVYQSLKRVAAGPDGAFRVAGLPPGSYRVAAVRQADARKLDQQPVLDRLLQGAKRVTLSPSATENLILAPSDPTR